VKLHHIKKVGFDKSLRIVEHMEKESTPKRHSQDLKTAKTVVKFAIS